MSDLLSARAANANHPPPLTPAAWARNMADTLDARAEAGEPLTAADVHEMTVGLRMITMGIGMPERRLSDEGVNVLAELWTQATLILPRTHGNTQALRDAIERARVVVVREEGR